MKTVSSLLGLLMITGSASAGPEATVPVLLLGPNPGIEKVIDGLPKTTSYAKTGLVLQKPHETRRLSYGYSGGIGAADVEKVLQVFGSKWESGYLPNKWSVFVRGNREYARLEITLISECGHHQPGGSWLFMNGALGWTVLERPFAMPPLLPCDVPAPTPQAQVLSELRMGRYLTVPS